MLASVVTESKHNFSSLSAELSGHRIIQYEFIAKSDKNLYKSDEKLPSRLFPFPHIGTKNDFSKATSANQKLLKNTIRLNARRFVISIAIKSV